jgi:transcriptional regulator with XRE-family HTH domain
MCPIRRYCCCGTLLARDNAAGLCGACQRMRRRDRAPDVPPEFWQSEAMATALDSGDLGRVVRAYRRHPFHGQPLPQDVLAGWLHVSQPTLSRIEQGRRRLTVDEIEGYARSLGLSVALRWAPQPEVGEDVDPLSRRSLFGAGAGAAVGLGATTAPAAARQVDPDLVAHWMRLLRLLGRHDAMFGPHAALDAVRQEIGLIADHRRLTRGVLRTQLLSVEARWCDFAGWLSNDAGDHARMEYWSERALRLAREAGDADMSAWVLLRRSRRAVQQHDASGAVACAEQAGRTRGASNRIRGLCGLKEAQGHALVGDATLCERSLANAHELLDPTEVGLEMSEPLGGHEDASPPYVAAAEARCWLWLRPGASIAMLEDVVRLLPLDRTRSRAIQQARLAQACAAAGKPDRAAAEGLRALDIARTTASELTMRELQRLDHQLATSDAPAVADFREALAAL